MSKRIAMVLAGLASGCSMMMVKGVDDGWTAKSHTAPACDTDAKFGTVVDGFGVGVTALMGLLAAKTGNCDSNDMNCQPSDVTVFGSAVISALVGAGFIYSIIEGRDRAAHCRAAQADYVLEISGGNAGYSEDQSSGRRREIEPTAKKPSEPAVDDDESTPE